MPDTDLSIRIDGPGFSTLLKSLKEADAEASKRVRRAIRASAKDAVADVRKAVLEPAPHRARRRKTYDVGVRQGIAAGIGIRISTASKGGSVRIVAAPSKMPAGHAPMLKAYNKKSFRHPVYGDTAHWVNQSGRPFFGAVIYQHRLEIENAVTKAVQEALSILHRA